MITYEMPISFTPDQFTSSGTVKASALQYVFQEIGGIHAEQLGLGFDAMMADNQIWVVTKLKYRLFSQLQPGVEYRLVTFPKPHRGMLYQRDYKIFDSADNLSVIGISQWCVMDYTTRKIVRTNKDFDGEFCTEVLFPEGFERFRPGQLDPAGTYTITQSDLDHNAHTNNCRYADMVEQVLPGQSGTDFSITFAHETRLGDTINLFTSPAGDHTIVCGMVDDQTVFSALV